MPYRNSPHQEIEILMSFETNDEIVDYFSGHGYNDIKFPYACGKENIYFMLHQKYIPNQEYYS